jgi:hypothetical protein
MKEVVGAAKAFSRMRPRSAITPRWIEKRFMVPFMPSRRDNDDRPH